MKAKGAVEYIARRREKGAFVIKDVTSGKKLVEVTARKLRRIARPTQGWMITRQPALERIRMEGGWRPVPPERRDWLSRTQQQEDAMAARAGAAMEPRRGSLPQGAHVRVIVPGSGTTRNDKSRKRRGRKR